MRRPALLLACILAGAAHAADYQTYWGRALPWARIAEVPGARSLHAGPREGGRDGDRALDVLTGDGRVLRFTKSRERLAYSPGIAYGTGDAAAYASTPGGRFVTTKDGRVLKETASGWTEMGQWSDVRKVDAHGSSLYVLVGDARIVRVPGPGQEETFYESRSGIRDIAASPLGAFFLSEGGVYFANRPGQALHLKELDADSVVKLVYGATNNGGEDSVSGRFEEIGLRSPPYVAGWLYVHRTSGEVGILKWDASWEVLVSDAASFHGYGDSDFNYYTYVRTDGKLVRVDFGMRRRGHGDTMRDADPDLLDYTSFDLVRFVLRRNGEILAASEVNGGTRPAAGTVLLPLAQIIRELSVEPSAMAGLNIRGERNDASWRLLAEDLASDVRPEVQAAKKQLPKMLEMLDPERIRDSAELYRRWLAVRPLLDEALAPLRAARGEPATDAIEELTVADHLLSEDIVPMAVAAACEKEADRVVEAVRARAATLGHEGGARLAKRLKRFQLKRTIGLIEWRLHSVVREVRDDARAGLWR